MTPDTAKLALQFMLRPDFKMSGAEVPAFNQVVNELQQDANPTPPDNKETDDG